MPLIVFDCKEIPATRRARIQTPVEAGGKHVKEQYEKGLLPIHFVVEFGCSSPGCRASSGPCCSLWTKILPLSPNASGRRSTNDSIVSSLRDSMTDMRS